MAHDFVYVTNCINAQGEDIGDMVDHPKCKEVTRKTFCLHVDIEQRQEIEHSCAYAVGSEIGLHMADDYMVSYWRSYYRGFPCYYFQWSAIEYVFIRFPEMLQKVKNAKCSNCGSRLFEPKPKGSHFPKNDEDEYTVILVCSICNKETKLTLET